MEANDAERGRRKSRCVTYVSRIDQEHLERGEPPSWQGASRLETELTDSTRATTENDSRLHGDVPPHWEESRL